MGHRFLYTHSITTFTNQGQKAFAGGISQTRRFWRLQKRVFILGRESWAHNDVLIRLLTVSTSNLYIRNRSVSTTPPGCFLFCPIFLSLILLRIRSNPFDTASSTSHGYIEESGHSMSAARTHQTSASTSYPWIAGCRPAEPTRAPAGRYRTRSWWLEQRYWRLSSSISLSQQVLSEVSKGPGRSCNVASCTGTQGYDTLD
jgi:hypothetical protein